MTRVVAGLAGGRRLRTPPGHRTRPTSDRVREALFSSLGSLEGAHVLDLYAGSGAVGLEALSRGAAEAVLVESDRAALLALRSNVAALVLPGARVVASTVADYLAAEPFRFDVIFADPPYDYDIDAVLAALAPWTGGVVVLERSSRSMPPSWPPPLAGLRSRRYGETTLWYGHSP